MGGLGNQLFQIFATIVHGMKTGRKIVFPDTELLQIGTIRRTYWNDFLSGLKTFTQSPDVIMARNFDTYNEPAFSYCELPLVNSRKSSSLLLTGYYQSYKYFDEKKDILFKLLRLREQKEAIRMQCSEYINNGYNNISMHFRLGDYKAIQDHHPLMSYEYYEKSLEYICAKKPNSKHRVLYFNQAEDNLLVSEYITRLKMSFSQVVFDKVNDKIPDWKQMLLMSCANDNIIANSTFSWWGAYFNEDTEKIVCYPAIWFGNKLAHDTKDLFIDSWRKN
jgi:hypothetical protein